MRFSIRTGWRLGDVTLEDAFSCAVVRCCDLLCGVIVEQRQRTAGGEAVRTLK